MNHETKTYTLEEIMEGHRRGSYQEMLNRAMRGGKPITLATIWGRSSLSGHSNRPEDLVWAEQHLASEGRERHVRGRLNRMTMVSKQLVADIAYQQLEKHLSDLPDEMKFRVYGIMVITAWKIIDRIVEEGKSAVPGHSREEKESDDPDSY